MTIEECIERSEAALIQAAARAASPESARQAGLAVGYAALAQAKIQADELAILQEEHGLTPDEGAVSVVTRR